MTFGIYLPTYKRPHALSKVAENIEKATKNEFVLYFGLEPEDKESIEAARATGHNVIINSGQPGYSDTIQTIYEATDEPIFMHANDDFFFLPNWDETPVAMFDSDWVKVVGVSQSDADRSYSAIQFIRRSYIEEQSGVVDMPNRVFYPYNHNYIDTEMTLTAQGRGVWAACDAPCILHQHPAILGLTEKDETYKKNDATAGADEETFKSRKHLFS